MKTELTHPVPRDAQVCAARQAAARGVVVTHLSAASAERDGHEVATQREIARRLAGLKGFVDGGEFESLARYPAPRYFLPNETLTSEVASRLGIRDENDLFGGVVPVPFVATKTITHSLLDTGARAPRGWSVEFPRRVAKVVLDGFSAFARDDALQGGVRLLEHGPVRVKLATGIAGLGQFVVDSEHALATALDRIDPSAMSETGVVVEQNLTDVTTYSVGQCRVGDTVATYYGTQQLTTNNHGASVYGGSEITVVRGTTTRCCVCNWPTTSASRSCKRAPTTMRRTGVSQASMRPAATTTLREVATPRVGHAQVCWSNPGGRVARAAPKSGRWKLSPRIRRYASCAR